MNIYDKAIVPIANLSNLNFHVNRIRFVNDEVFSACIKKIIISMLIIINICVFFFFHIEFHNYYESTYLVYKACLRTN